MIMREYSRRQSESRRTLEEHREEAYREIPRIREIDAQVASLCAARARELLCGDKERIDDLKQEVAALSEERLILLQAKGYPKDYLEPAWVCPNCQDTGYIDGEKCSCFKRMEVELLYTQSNLREILEKENFDHFSFDYYSDRIRNESTGLTALETARQAYDMARNFVDTFERASENLFIYGNTGVGKTFLSHCIAKALLDRSHFVLYFSAYDLFDLMAKATFSRSRETETQESFIYDCDLLIIDDLGTELTNSFVSSQLFLCINERLSRRKSTIISTNLKLENFSDTYSERTFSRIASNYRLIKLIGDDIRIRKLF
jgi:DNA replication protein DnaC